MEKRCFSIKGGTVDLATISYTNAYILVKSLTAKDLRLSSANGGVSVENAFYPDSTANNRLCGTAVALWSAVWATNGVIQTSDQRNKTDITPSILGLNFIKKLNPVSYKWVDGGNTPIKDEYGNEVGMQPNPGRRTHYGLISQNVKQSYEECGATDFAGWVLTDINDPDSQQALRYHQFISPMIKAIQEQQEMIENLKSRLDAAGIP